MRRSRRLGKHWLVAVAVVGAMVAAGCGGGSSSPKATGSTATPGSGHLGADAGNTTGATTYVPTGPLVADSGFRPETNGFGFQNYGALTDTFAGGAATDSSNLIAADMQKLFGDQACVDASTGKCDLSPQAQAWMDHENGMMGGGHCFGFSVASLLFWKSQVKSADYGAGDTPTVPLPGNVPVQRLLAYAFSFQSLPQVQAGEVTGTPNDIVDKLMSVLKPDQPETYTIGIFKRDGNGGHAITPYGIEDHGGGIFEILVYDNNFPKITRHLTVDRNANTWAYDASINPSEASEHYEGDANTKSLLLFPTTPGVTPGPCPFCGKDGAPGSGNKALGSQASPTAAEPTQIDLDGSDQVHGHLLITDDAGHQTGYVGDKFVNDIPGATVDRSLSGDWTNALEPSYVIPPGVHFTVTVDGSALKQEDDTVVSMIGDAFDLTVSGIHLMPGDKQTLDVAPDGSKVSYTTSDNQSPTFELGASYPDADYAFTFKGEAITGGTLTALFPIETGTLTIDTSAMKGSGTYSLDMEREDATGVLDFSNNSIALATGDKATLDYGSWDTNGADIPLVIEHNGASQTQNLPDQGR